MRLIGYGLILIVMVITISQVVVYGPKLPDRVASHFGSDGQADDTMSKAGFLMMYCAMQGGLLLIMLGVGWLCRILPSSMINIPHRAYWLHPDRKDQTMRFLDGMSAWMAVVTCFFMAALFQLTFQANLAEHPSLNNTLFIWLMVLFFCGLAIVVIIMILKFARVPK